MYTPVDMLWAQVRPLMEAAKTVPFPLGEATVAVFRVGSHSHGTHIPPDDPDGIDDTDLMVIVIPPPAYVLGLKRFEHASFKVGEWDVVVYEWSKWLRLLMKQNPNVVGTLWLEHEDEYYPLGRLSSMIDLQNRRHRVMSKLMYASFVGYARGQLHRMTHFAHQGYMGEKRKKLVAEHGYDVKNAAHLLRLLTMAVGCLSEGVLRVRCAPTDAEFFRNVKRGFYAKDEIIRLAEGLFTAAERALAKSPLQETPDAGFIERRIIEGYFEHWGVL